MSSTTISFSLKLLIKKLLLLIDQLEGKNKKALSEVGTQRKNGELDRRWKQQREYSKSLGI